ncbi:MAG: dihydrofolate reductase family protein [Lewinella sp.]|uniref:dihydrofolate reductase family protein n=1 Tax=Lewinella sp. TaxID=2004506 RepID=UPI003D6BAB56
MKNKNKVFIATSLDGYIADKNGGIDWLFSIPNPDQIDMGYSAFTAQIDALVMGRTTFETVCGFDVDWPYKKPVFVLSRTLTEIPAAYKDKVFLVKGTLTEVLAHIHEQGFHHLYIDGGATIQSFLKEDLIDEMIITTIPVLLGGGSPLFGDLSATLAFECTGSTIFLDKVVQNHYRRVRETHQ